MVLHFDRLCEKQSFSADCFFRSHLSQTRQCSAALSSVSKGALSKSKGFKSSNDISTLFRQRRMQK